MGKFLDPELQGTDRALDTWAKDRRDSSGSPKCTLYNMALVKEGVVLEGPREMSDVSMAIDNIYLSSPGPTRAIITNWYCEPTPVRLKANRLGVSPATIYTVWKSALWYFRGRLHGSGFKL